MAETSVQPNNKSVVFRGQTERAMPLKEGASQGGIGQNIATETGAGKPQKQAGAKIPRKARRAHAKGMISERAMRKHFKGVP